MNMKSLDNDYKELNEEFNKVFTYENDDEKIEADAYILMAKFLSEVQEEADKQGINRKQLAAKIGTSASYLTQLFRGHKLLNLITAAKLQNALGIQFDISRDSTHKQLKQLESNFSYHTKKKRIVSPDKTKRIQTFK